MSEERRGFKGKSLSFKLNNAPEDFIERLSGLGDPHRFQEAAEYDGGMFEVAFKERLQTKNWKKFIAKHAGVNEGDLEMSSVAGEPKKVIKTEQVCGTELRGKDNLYAVSRTRSCHAYFYG